jgi:folate-binding protein YgfZ
MTDALAAVHEAHGVRWGAGAAGTRLPRNYGDPAAEYAAARGGAAVIDRSDRHFLRVHGRDPVRMLQGLITNDIANAPADRAVYAAVLTAKGRMVADVRVLRRDAELLLETDAAAVEPLTGHLRKYVPPLFARFEDADATWHALSVVGPDARRTLLAALAIDLPDGGVADDDVVVAGDGILVASSLGDVPGWDLLLPGAAQVEDAWRRLVAAGAVPAGHATLDVLRIEAGIPRWGAELTDSTIPLEAGLRQRAISETKGCYTGQEVIIRILHRGHVNWLLRGLLLGDVPAPAAATSLVNDAGKAVGRITSAAWSPAHGQTVALGYVRREVEPPATLRLVATEGPEVTVVALPFAPA